MPIQEINSAVEVLERVKVFKTYKKPDHIHQQPSNGGGKPINCFFSITITYQYIPVGHFAPLTADLWVLHRMNSHQASFPIIHENPGVEIAPSP